MNDLKLEEIDFSFDGRVYKLRCNMNVLADFQYDIGGSISPAFAGRAGYKTTLSLLAAMLNDYAEDMGWPERYTRRELGKKLSFEDFKELPSLEMHRMLAHSVGLKLNSEETAPDGSKEEEKN